MIKMDNRKLDKQYFYQMLEPFGKSKHIPIFIDMTLNKENLRYRLIFSWTNIKPNGDFNPIMSAQLIDTHQQGSKKYVVPDLIFDTIIQNTTTQYRLFKYLSNWIDRSFEKHKED